MGATAETPYTKLNDTTKIAVLGGIKPDLKKLVYRFIVRTKDVKGAYPATAQKQLRKCWNPTTSKTPDVRCQGF